MLVPLVVPLGEVEEVPAGLCPLALGLAVHHGGGLGLLYDGAPQVGARGTGGVKEAGGDQGGRLGLLILFHLWRHEGI